MAHALCKTCKHPSLGEIEKLLAAGHKAEPLAHRFGLSTDSIRRHWKGHVTPEQVARLQGKMVFGRDGIDPDMLAQLRQDESDRLILRLAHTRGELNALAKSAASDRVRVMAYGTLVRLAEVEARILGEIKSGTTVTNQNLVIQSGSDMAELRALIDSALAPYPEARSALLSALARETPIPQIEGRVG